MKADLAAFRELWLPRLNRGASALLFCEDGPVEAGLHTAIADAPRNVFFHDAAYEQADHGSPPLHRHDVWTHVLRPRCQELGVVVMITPRMILERLPSPT